MKRVILLLLLAIAVLAAGCYDEVATVSAGETSDKIEIVKSEFTAVGRGVLGIEGTLKNVHDDRIREVVLTAKFYDADDVRIGDGLTSIRNIDAGETARYTIRYYGDGTPDRGEIDEIKIVC